MADYPADFRGGLFTAGGDMNGDGHSDISARLKVFALEGGTQPQQKLDEILADPNFRGGGFVGGVARR